MSPRRYFSLMLALMTFITLPMPVSAAEDSEAVAQDLALIFRSARKVISDNQSKINDANLGNKGLSAEAVIELAKANYKATSGKDMSSANDGSSAAKARIALLGAVSKVMSDAQAMINEKGVGFKGFLPAVFAGRVAQTFSADPEVSGKYKIKLTAPKEWVRNRANRPDKWEDDVIANRFKAAGYEKGKAFSETTTVSGKAAFRYILPEYYGESCLGCHGEPKGETDITGGKKEGGKLGQLGGAISVTVFP